MKPVKRVSKRTGEVSYLFRVNLDYHDGQQIIKAQTWKPDKGMTPKQIEKELLRQQVLFEEKAKQDYQEQLKREAEQADHDDEIEYVRKHTTFKQLADEWLNLQEYSGEMKHSSLQRMKSCKDRTYAAIGDKLISKLSYRDVKYFISSLAQDGVNKFTGKGLSQKTQKHYLTFVSDVMNYAKDCGYIAINPCVNFRFTKSVKTEITAYSLDEVKQLLAKIDSEAPTEYKLFYNLLAYCGLRRGEALGLEFKDINFERSTLNICRTSNYHVGYGTYTDTPKTKNSYRTLFIQPKLISLIQQLHKERRQQAKDCGDQWVENDRLFVNWQGKPLSPNVPHKWLQRFCEKDNLPFHGLHSFRHFAATQAIANGQDIKRVSNMLGHSQASTTINIYAHAVQQANEDALNCIAGLIEAS